MRGLKRAGHEVRMAGGDRAAIRATASWAETVLVAVPFDATSDVVAGAGEALVGKTVIDVTQTEQRTCQTHCPQSFLDTVIR